MKTCKICYRQFDDKDMKRNITERVTNQCKTCFNFIGKGVGYQSQDDEEFEKWLEGYDKRKREYKEDNNVETSQTK